ncbi:acetyltransferase [Chryseobacterium turcicum]|uniref:Acetyltransferase n=1 Tax=Chryseobacterium turcicum TaxID=2898076 RepID=A0A9Q3YV53_9FLAO|nr:acetyltransferase [Chryseobacterium turcicum]MCD1116488.1 acetyltransferase [Chryseobacterium turcicum]
MYLYGASGHGKVIAEIAEENNLIIEAFIDQDKSKKQLLDYHIIHEVPNSNIDVVVSIGNNLIRKSVVDLYQQLNYIKLFHPKSIISKRVRIEEGTVVMAGATINSEVAIGKHCIINTNASIDHDCIFDNFVHISPNVSIAGNVEIGEGTHIGIGSSIIQGIKIGRWCTIGAGAVIIRDIPDGATVVGNPGKVIRS